ncbi:MAG TPA: ABC transporter permease [Pirellulaceae bacterium]|nr:ABC transporter permease [Pirellulaceae bacterium]
MKLLRFVTGQLLPPLALLVVVLAIWQGVVRYFEIPLFLLPAPSDVFASARTNAAMLLTATGYTLQAALLGFVCSLVLGTLVSFAFAQFPLARRCGYPYAVFLQTVPIVAIAPLVIAICGTNVRSVILVATIISLFPIITNVTTGLLAIDPRLREYFRVQRATRWQLLTKLQIPTAIPYLVTGAKTSSGLAMVGAIVGEFFAGYGQDRYGLGQLIQASSDTSRTERVMAAVIASALCGIAIFATVNLFAWLALRRWTQA